MSDKDTREQTAAAAGKKFQRFVEHTFVLFLCDAFRLNHFHHMCLKRVECQMPFPTLSMQVAEEVQNDALCFTF